MPRNPATTITNNPCTVSNVCARSLQTLLNEEHVVPLHTTDSDALHHDGGHWVVVPRLHIDDLIDEIHTLCDFAKDWVLGISTAEPIQEVILCHVKEELRTSTVGRASIRHGEGAWHIAVPGDVFVLNVSTIGTFLHRASLQVLELSIRRPTSAGATTLRILCVRAAELCHEIWDNS